jgi:hypothetical protein
MGFGKKMILDFLLNKNIGPPCVKGATYGKKLKKKKTASFDAYAVAATEISFRVSLMRMHQGAALQSASRKKEWAL